MDYNHTGYHTRYALEQYDNYDPKHQIIVSFKQKTMPGKSKLDDPAFYHWDDVDGFLYGVEIGHSIYPQIHHPNDLVVPFNEIIIDYSKFFGMFDKKTYVFKHISNGGFTRHEIVKCVNDDYVKFRDAIPNNEESSNGNWTFQHDPYFDLYGVVQSLTDKHVFYISVVIPCMYMRECHILPANEEWRLSNRTRQYLCYYPRKPEYK